MNLVTVTNTAQELKVSPALEGKNGVIVNLSGGALTFQGSNDGTTYATLGVAFTGNGMQQVTLPRFIRLSAAGTGFLLVGP